MNFFRIVFMISITLVMVTSAKSDDLVYRPMAGIGYASSYGQGQEGWGYHAGMRCLLSANEKQSYGLEAVYLAPYALSNPSSRIQYLSTGIVLEQIMAQWFNMSIGTVGYWGCGENTRRTFGLVTNLGWEPKQSKGIRPFVTYRSEWIMDEPVLSISAISIGASF